MRLRHIVVLATIFWGGRAHYAFPALIINGIRTENWQYVRNVTHTYLNYNQGTFEPGLYPLEPLFDLSSKDIICGRNGTYSGSQTGIADVVAGDEIGFAVDQGPLANPVINHNGPALAYLSPVPPGKDLHSYEGDGEWFKFGYLGPATRSTWIAANAHSLNFTIPKTTPPGKYLLRVEHINLLNRFNETQFYANCAQINVIGQGGGVPGPLVRFPSAYSPTDPSILVPTEILFPDAEEGEGLFAYRPPGPPLWSG